VVNSSADVEAAKKEALQAQLRANQLANENAKLIAEQEAIRQKQLEEKEEFKTLYEQTQSKLNEIQEAQAAVERQGQLSSATQEVLKDYPANVQELAKTVGLSLTDDSEASKAVLKEKLDSLHKQVGGTVTAAGSNNPRQLPPQDVNRQELTTRNSDGISPMAMASARGDESVVRSYIKGLPAIERMKEIARGGM
jgi:predicted nuclease with TOPRIM domain